MTMRDMSLSRVPAQLHFHLLPFYAGKAQLYGHLHGREEQVANVFQGCGERASL